MQRLNQLEEMRAHANLGGAIFKGKPITLQRLTGLTSFGLVGLTYAYFPLVAGMIGKTSTMLGMSAFSLYGMQNFHETDIVNSITLVKEGEHQGKLKINVSSSLITSRDIIADVNNTQAIFSLSNEDDNDLDNNVIGVSDYHDC